MIRLSPPTKTINLSINTENFPPINIQKFPVGLKGLGFLDSHFPLF